MVKFIGVHQDNGRVMLGLGLVRGNVDRLIAGQPIQIHAEQLETPVLRVHEVVIFFGETEEAIERQFREAGLLETTRRVIDERDRRPS